MTIRCHSFFLLTFVLICCGSGAASPAVDVPDKYPPLEMHGETYPNTCTAPQKKNLHEALLASRVHDTEGAWRAIDAMLCTPSDDANRRYVKTLVPKKIKQTVESTGDQPEFKLVARSDKLIGSLIADGRAWNADVSAEPTKIVLQYFANEACVRSKTLTFENRRWSLTDVGEACD